MYPVGLASTQISTGDYAQKSHSPITVLPPPSLTIELESSDRKIFGA